MALYSKQCGKKQINIQGYEIALASNEGKFALFFFSFRCKTH